MMRRTRYQWSKHSPGRVELLLMGEPDCYAYAIRYSSRWGNVWCWTLTMPRGGHRYHGWHHTLVEAKLDVERTIALGWGE